MQMKRNCTKHMNRKDEVNKFCADVCMLSHLPQECISNLN